MTRLGGSQAAAQECMEATVVDPASYQLDCRAQAKTLMFSRVVLEVHKLLYAALKDWYWEQKVCPLPCLCDCV